MTSTVNIALTARLLGKGYCHGRNAPRTRVSVCTDLAAAQQTI